MGTDRGQDSAVVAWKQSSFAVPSNLPTSQSLRAPWTVCLDGDHGHWAVHRSSSAYTDFLSFPAQCQDKCACPPVLVTENFSGPGRKIRCRYTPILITAVSIILSNQGTHPPDQRKRKVRLGRGRLNGK